MQSIPTILLVAEPPERLLALSRLLDGWPLVAVSSPLLAAEELVRPEIVLIVAALTGQPQRHLAALRDLESGRVRPILFLTSNPPPQPAPFLVEFIGTALEQDLLATRIAFLLELVSQGDQAQQKLFALAHDLNNMLTVTLWNLDLLARAKCGSEKDQQRIEIAMGGALRCAGLIRELIPPRESGQ